MSVYVGHDGDSSMASRGKAIQDFVHKIKFEFKGDPENLERHLGVIFENFDWCVSKMVLRELFWKVCE